MERSHQDSVGSVLLLDVLFPVVVVRLIHEHVRLHEHHVDQHPHEESQGKNKPVDP